MIFAPFAFQNKVVTGGGGIPIVTSGLTFYVTANDTTSYPGSGTVWYDLSGNGYNGTLTNGPTFTTTGSTSWFQYDGTNDFTQWPTGANGSETGSFTMSIWVKGITSNSAQVGLLMRGQSSSDWSLRLENEGTGNNVDMGAAAALTSGGSLAGIYAYDNARTFGATTWYYLTGVWTSGVSVKFYYNGTLDNTTTTTRSFLRNNSTGWNQGRYGTSYYSFGCAEVMVYSRVLSDSEILSNFNNTKSKYGY